MRKYSSPASGKGGKVALLSGSRSFYRPGSSRLPVLKRFRATLARRGVITSSTEALYAATFECRHEAKRVHLDRTVGRSCNYRTTDRNPSANAPEGAQAGAECDLHVQPPFQRAGA